MRRAGAMQAREVPAARRVRGEEGPQPCAEVRVRVRVRVRIRGWVRLRLRVWVRVRHRVRAVVQVARAR